MKLVVMDENFLQIEQIRAREGILHSIWNFLEIPAKDLHKEHGLDQTRLILPPHFMSCWEPIDVDISSCVSWLDVWKKIDGQIGKKVEDYERFMRVAFERSSTSDEEEARVLQRMARDFLLPTSSILHLTPYFLGESAAAHGA